MKTLRAIFTLGAAMSLAACLDTDSSQTNAIRDAETSYTQQDLDKVLADPIARSELIVKVMGSTQREDTHAYMKFHIYGFTGEGNIIPFFTMHNYFVQKWTPIERGTYELRHFEVAYYSDFDTDTPLEDWVNPITNKVNDVPTLVLGPIDREYTPEGIIAMGLGPDPLNISIVGDRIFIPTQSINEVGNPLASDEWGQYSTGPTVYWDSLMTYSADLNEALNPERTRAPSEIYLQNLVSWQPNFQMGRSPGRTMVRAFGGHIDGPQDIPKTVYENLQKFAPEIFDTESWTELRMDSIDYMTELEEKRAAGELVIEPLK